MLPTYQAWIHINWCLKVPETSQVYCSGDFQFTVFFFSLFLRHDSWFEFYISKHHSSLDVMLRHKAPGHKALLSSSVDWRTKWLAVFFNLSWHLSRKKNLPLLVKYLGKSDTEFSFSEKARPFVSLFDTSRSKGWLVAGR